MIVTNQALTMAVVIRHDGQQVTLVPMRSGKLTAQRLLASQFNHDWQTSDYPLEKAVQSFLAHARDHGASKEVLNGLERLAKRDQDVVVSLF